MYLSVKSSVKSSVKFSIEPIGNNELKLRKDAWMEKRKTRENFENSPLPVKFEKY